MGFVNKALVLDWEATGLIKEIDVQHWDRGPQGIEIGAILVDDLTGTCEPVWEFTTRVKFVHHEYPGLTWDTEAEKIHGIAPSALLTAPTPYTVCNHLDKFLNDYYRDEPILLCGQNPMYDRYFLNQLYRLSGREPPKLHGRMIDTFTMGLILWGHQTGNELFEHATGTKRTLHSALGDARSTHEALKLAFRKTARLKIE